MAGYPPTCFAPQITQMGADSGLSTDLFCPADYADGGLYAALSAAFVFCPADGRQVCQDGVWHAECHFYLYNINIWRYFYLQIPPFSCNFAFAKLKSLSLTPPSPGGVFPFAQMPPPQPRKLVPMQSGRRGFTFCLRGCEAFRQKGRTPFRQKGRTPFRQKGRTPLGKRVAPL